jgi:hypothetical protein
MKPYRNCQAGLKRLQHGGRKSMLRKSWKRFTVLYSMRRFLKSGGGVLLLHYVNDEVFTPFSSISCQVGRSLPPRVLLGLSLTLSTTPPTSTTATSSTAIQQSSRIKSKEKLRNLAI